MREAEFGQVFRCKTSSRTVFPKEELEKVPFKIAACLKEKEMARK